jgi:AraC family transcriptional regulator
MINTEVRKPKRLDTVEFHTNAMRRVISAVRARLDDNISLKDMAALAYMSRFHFNRTFRRVTGLPPRRFLSALRVQSATRMLLETDHSVTDICLDVGYTSLGTFVRRFSELLGLSPMKLRSMRRSPVGNLLREADSNAHSRNEISGSCVTGRINGPPAFSGPMFVGLFASAIPEGMPLACTILSSPGSFRICGSPQGSHYLFAVGLPWPSSLGDYFNYDKALVGGGQIVSVGKGTVYYGDVSLRPPAPTDPPILVNFPILLDKARRTYKAA